MLASAGTSVKFWNVEDYSLIETVSYSKSDVTSSLSWNKDGKFLVALQRNSSEVPLYAVSAKSANCVNIFKIIDKPKALQFANTAIRYLAFAGAKDTVLVWDIKNNSKKKTFKVPVRNGVVTKLSFNTNDSHLTVGSTSGDVFLLSNTNNLVTGPIRLFKEKTPVTDIQFSLKCPSIVGASGENGCVSIMDVNSKTVLKEFSDAHSAPVSGLCFSPINELLMVTVGYDKKFVSYNVNAKREIISHTSSAPLTSVCFVGNGQYIALGTMLGSIIIHDLRMLKSSVAELLAYDGCVLSLKLQPLSTNLGVQAAKGAPKNVANCMESKSSRAGKEFEKVHSNTPVTKVTVGSGVVSTLLSPITLLKNEEAAQQTDTYQKSSLKSSKDSFRFDDLGILSPIDKENQSPAPGFEYANWKNTRSNEEAKAFEDLLSPLHETRQGRVLNLSQPSQTISKNLDVLMDECLSPVGKTLNSTLERDSASKNPSSVTEFTLPLSEEDRQQLRTSTRGMVKEAMYSQPRSSTTFSPNASGKPREHLLTTEDLSMLPNITSSSQKLSTKTDKRESNLKPFSQDADIEGKEPSLKLLSKSDHLELDRNREKDRMVRFESSTDGRATEQPQETESSRPEAAASNMNLELVQNCFEETLENFQFDVNKRFMHVQYLMTKQFLQLQNDMRRLFQENSLNEEILLENERLREEIRRLKSNY